MNPIEHTTQTQVSAASQGIAALLGGGSTGKSQGAEGSPVSAAAFADALNIAGKPAQVAGAEATLPQDYIAAFGALIPALDATSLPQGIALPSVGGVEPQLQFSETLTGSAATLSEDVLKVVPNDGAVNFAAYALSAQEAAEPLPGLDALTSLPALNQAGANDGHVLPIAELTALIGADDTGALPALGGAAPTAGTAAVDAAPVVAPAPIVPAPPRAVPVDPLAALVATDPAAAPEGVAGLVAPLVAQAPKIQVSPVDSAPVPAAAAAQVPADDIEALAASAAAATEAANAAAQAVGAKDEAAQAAEAKSAQQGTSPEGQIVPAQQAQQSAAPAQTQVQGGKKPTTDAVSGQKLDTQSGAKADTVAGSKSFEDHLTTRAIDPVVARAEVQAAPQAAHRDMSLALTPERLAGLPEGSASEAVAAGLNSLSGRPSFLDSMGLMGGRPSPSFAAHVAQQFNLQVSKSVLAGEHQFTMRLDPAELGRVEVKLHFSKSGEVSAKVTAERPETLELLQRDAKGLEKALTANGQKLEQGGISFNLDNSGEQSAGRAFAEAVMQEKMRDELAARSAAGPLQFMDTAEEQVPLETILPHVSAETGLDIRV